MSLHVRGNGKTAASVFVLCERNNIIPKTIKCNPSVRSERARKAANSYTPHGRECTCQTVPDRLETNASKFLADNWMTRAKNAARTTSITSRS